MSDPFLLAHSVKHLCYWIAGSIWPVSIRDQMIRGRMLVDRAVEAGLIDSAGRDLLVIGAGAGGVTAAVHAAQKKKVPTTLIDVATSPFSRQAGCVSRWVDPTQYDWPVQHWDEGRYHWTNPEMPLPWSANYASKLATRWTLQFKLALSQNPLLTFLHKTTLHNEALVGESLQVQLEDETGTITKNLTFGMMLISVGFGTERCTLGDYSGFRFWDKDRYDKPNLDLPSDVTPRVLISGGGDGGLQDFIRVLTVCKSAKHLYHELQQELLPPVGQEPDWLKIERRVQSAEDQAQRAFVWGTGSHHDHHIHDVLHRIHEDVIDDLQNNQLVWNNITRKLQVLIRQPVPYTKFMYPCTHFSNCYGLNRFLNLLLARYLQERLPDRVILRPQTKLVSIKSAMPSMHQCMHNPEQCHGKKHIVTWRFADCFGSGATVFDDDWEYDVVILRHGIESAPMFLQNTTPIPNPRQILPYHVIV